MPSTRHISALSMSPLTRLVPLLVIFALYGCRIEPPLLLPTQQPNVEVMMGEVVTDLELIWDIDSDWRRHWWYGWDQEDIRQWGDIAYPIPTNYEVRFYFYGEPEAYETWQSYDRTTIFDTNFRRQFPFGYHNMLIWSNIDSPDGTQTLIVDEHDPDNINATTSRSRLNLGLPSREDIHNNPEIFYSGSIERLYVSRDTLDYDYYDAGRNTWVKQSQTKLYPLVYIYLVQVVLHNNHGRITGLVDNAGVNSLANGVNMHTGHTSNKPVIVTFPMRFKRGLHPDELDEDVDILGTKFTTFGLCDMDSWSKSRGAMYGGSRTELTNHLSVGLAFSNSTDSAYHYDITPQMQRQAHGGIITVEIDVDTLTMPHPPNTGTGSMFDPMIAPGDTITHEFEM